MTINKASLLAALATTITTVEVEGFGPVALRQITVAENDAIRATHDKDAAKSDFGLRLVLASVVDDTGALLLSADDLAALRASAGAKVDKLVEAVLLANGYAKPAAGTDAAKNAAS